MDGEQYQHSPPMEDVDDETLVPSDDGYEAIHQPYPHELQQPVPTYGNQRPDWQEPNHSGSFDYGKGRPKPDRKWKAQNFCRVIACSLVLIVTGVVASAAGYGASLHKEPPTSTRDNQTATIPDSLACPITDNMTWFARRADLSSQYLTVKNVTMLGPQRSTSVTNLSRDGGSSVLLNGNIVWLYDDTASRNKNGSILSFLSNTAAYSSEPNGSTLLVRDFGVVLADQSNPFQLETGILANEMVRNGGWIPFTEEEAEINQKDPSQKRVAICKCFTGPNFQLEISSPDTSIPCSF